MATTTGTPSGIGSTITDLEAELPHLEDRQHGLEKDLAAVTERLAAVRIAVTSLKALASAPASLAEPEAAQSSQEADAAPAQPAADEQPSSAKAEAVPAPRRAGETKARQAKPAKSTAAKKTRAATAKQPEAPAAGKPAKAEKAAKTAVSAKPAKSVKAKAGDEAPAKRTRTPGLSQSIVAVLGKAKKPLRAGEVNETLGREKSNGSVNSVRTALERLVANRDIQRVGRGLYEANQG